MQVQELLKEAGNNIKQLIEQHRQLTEQAVTLKKQLAGRQAELEQLMVEKENLQHENKELKEQIKTIKLAQSLTAGSGDQSSRQVKTKINEYIREIDKCLSLLNRE